nr:unnamed protein product [Callosobruchus chinensis]
MLKESPRRRREGLRTPAREQPSPAPSAASRTPTRTPRREAASPAKSVASSKSSGRTPRRTAGTPSAKSVVSSVGKSTTEIHGCCMHTQKIINFDGVAVTGDP